MSEEFNFEGEEIEILNNGEKLKSNKGVRITSSNGVVITAQEFEYDKNNSELFVEKDVLVNDVINNTIIKTNKIKYVKNLEQIFTSEDTEIEIEKKAVKAKVEIGLSPEEEIVQDSLKAAMDAAEAMGSEVLADQIGNTITYFTRQFVVGSNSD